MNHRAIITMKTTYHTDPLDPTKGYRQEVPIRWEGGEVAEVNWRDLRMFVKSSFPKPGDWFYFGPWRVIVVGVNFSNQTVEMVRYTPNGLWVAAQYFLSQKASWFKVRVIATLAIWGLADYKWNLESQWRDIYLIGWFYGRSKRS